MQAGRVAAYGEPESVVDQYLKSVREQLTSEDPSESVSQTMTDADRPIRIDTVALYDREGRARQVFATDGPRVSRSAIRCSGRYRTRCSR